MESNRRNSIFLAVSLLSILVITVLSRVPTLTRTVRLGLLWSYTSLGHWKQIILNICLFVPLGYFLVSLTRPRYTFLISLITSITVELIQFATYRGMLDVDDLVSNCIGAAIGLLIWKTIRGGWKTIASWIMLAASVVGCIITCVSSASSSIDVNETKEFQFKISSVATSDGKIELEGECFFYSRKTPEYTIFIGDKEAATTVNGQMFKATISPPAEKVEVQIKFRGFPVIPTGTWINGDRVEYVAGVEPIIRGVPEGAVLKAWNEEFDVLVYLNGDRLLWLIGMPIDQNTEVIYHIHTDEPEKLPDNRIPFGFDNRGFRVKIYERADNELENAEHYRVFERMISEDYHITAIVVGFNTDGVITWNNSFRVDIFNPQ